MLFFHNMILCVLFIRWSMIFWTAAQMTSVSSVQRELNKVLYLNVLLGIRQLSRKIF